MPEVWGTSPLFIVRVRTLSPDNWWVIAILVRCCQMSHPAHAGMLPNDFIPLTQEWLIRYLLYKVVPNDVRVQRSLFPRIGHFLTTRNTLHNVTLAYGRKGSNSNQIINRALHPRGTIWQGGTRARMSSARWRRLDILWGELSNLNI